MQPRVLAAKMCENESWRKGSERVRANILSARTFSAARETFAQKHTEKVSDTHILFGGVSKLLHANCYDLYVMIFGFQVARIEVLKINFNLLSIFSEQIKRSDHASSGRFNTRG